MTKAKTVTEQTTLTVTGALLGEPHYEDMGEHPASTTVAVSAFLDFGDFVECVSVLARGKAAEVLAELSHLDAVTVSGQIEVTGAVVWLRADTVEHVGRFDVPQSLRDKGAAQVPQKITGALLNMPSVVRDEFDESGMLTEAIITGCAEINGTRHNNLHVFASEDGAYEINQLCTLDVITVIAGDIKACFGNDGPAVIISTDAVEHVGRCEIVPVDDSAERVTDTPIASFTLKNPPPWEPAEFMERFNQKRVLDGLEVHTSTAH